MSTLKRPSPKMLARFDVRQIGDDTIADYLKQDFSLAICCRACPRLAEWTPPELSRRFSGKVGIRVAEIARRLVCDACASHDVAVFPHLYDRPR